MNDQDFLLSFSIEFLKVTRLRSELQDAILAYSEIKKIMELKGREPRMVIPTTSNVAKQTYVVYMTDEEELYKKLEKAKENFEKVQIQWTQDQED